MNTLLSSVLIGVGIALAMSEIFIVHTGLYMGVIAGLSIGFGISGFVWKQ